MPLRSCGETRGHRDPDLFRPELYEVEPISGGDRLNEYQAFLEAHYDPLGFDAQSFQPSELSSPYTIRFQSELAAIFRLTQVTDPSSVYYRLVPGAIRPDGAHAKLLEVNNVVIARRYRASAVLGLILYNSACVSHERGFGFVVGLNRFQILRYFVDFGVMPAEHPPEHVLGKQHLQDFVNYYDTADPASVDYMHERARRYFRQEYVMCRLREQYVKPQRPAAAPAAWDAIENSSSTQRAMS